MKQIVIITALLILSSCGSSQKNAVQIGMPALSGQQYSWSPADGLDDASKAQPMANPQKTTKYTVVAKSQCGESTSSMTVHVFKKQANGELVEVL